MDDCDWCNNVDLDWRVIKRRELSYSFVSKPWFRDGHCLIVPRRHVGAVSEMTPDESAEIMEELGRLSELLDEGYGTGIIQKYMPLQEQNSVKMNHLHFHVFPRQKNEVHLFPVPNPNSFEGFYMPSDEVIGNLAKKLR